jgi:hypothetical protein
MATVKIGDRELRVLESHEPGGFRVQRDLARAKTALVAAGKSDDPETIAAALVETIFAWLGPPVNPDLTREWLDDNLPADSAQIIRDCAAAAAKRPASGEEARQ